MDKFLERHKLQNMTIAEIENLSRPMTSKRIKLVILKLPTKANPHDSIGEFYQIFKE